MVLRGFEVKSISEILFPRPVVLVTTCDASSKPNVATFSFVMPVSFSPMYVAFAVSPKRHSFKNLQEVGEFVLHVVPEELLDASWICGTRSGRDVDKFSLAGLKTRPSSKVRPPRIVDCPVQLECVVEAMPEYGDHYLVVGRVVEVHVEKPEYRPILHHTGTTFYKIGEKVSPKG